MAAPLNGWVVPDRASWFHSIKHHNLPNGGSITEIFNEPDKWGISIAWIAGAFATVAFAYLTWDLIIRLIGSCCCTCLCKRKPDADGYAGLYGGQASAPKGGWCTSDGWMGQHAKPGHKCRWWFACIIFIVSIAIFSMCHHPSSLAPYLNRFVNIVPAIVASFNIKKNVDDMVVIARDTDAYRGEIVSDGDTLMSIIDNTLVTVASIKANADGQQNIINECNSATSALNTAKDNIQSIDVVDQSGAQYIDDSKRTRIMILALQ
jgi:hypothetical protein